MKKFAIPAILAVALSILGCKSENSGKFTIDIQVPSAEYDSIGCYFSRDSIAAYSLWQFEKQIFDSTGNIHMEVDRDEITWVFFTMFTSKYKGGDDWTKNTVFLLAQPGKSYRIEYDSLFHMLFRIKGDDEEAQNFYNTYSHSDVNGTPGINWLTNSDSIPKDLLQHLNDSIQQSFSPFQQLYNQGKIDQEFYQTALTQIQYAHSKAFIHQLRMRQNAYKYPHKWRYPGLIPLAISDKDLIQIIDKVFTSYPVSNRSARMNPDWDQNIDYYLNLKSWTDSEVTPLTDSMVTWPKSTYYEKMKRVKLADKYIEEDLVEQYFAHQFGSASLKSGADSLATYLYPEFKNRYPDSKYLPGIKRHIHNLTNFYTSYYPDLEEPKNNDASREQNVTYIFFPEVQFLEEPDTISNLTSLLSHFQGKNLYIDFWASWCPPCRYEFRFKDSVLSYLDDLNIEMLYISTDTEEAKWLNTIKNYDLKGYHFRVSNPELKKEIDRIVHFIPTYWLVDSSGEVIDFDAESPHSKSILYNQLVDSFK